MGEEYILPFWMEIMFGPGILWFAVMPFLGSLIVWKFIFENSSDEVQKHDRRVSVFKTWLTAFLCNLLSCVVLLVVELIMRSGDSAIRFSSLEIWNSPLTVTVYAIPCLISFFVISAQVRHRAHYMVSDRIPARISSWLFALVNSPWFILIPASVVHNLSDLID